MFCPHNSIRLLEPYTSITSKVSSSKMPQSVTFSSATNTSFGQCNSFASTYQHDPAKTARINATFSKTTPSEVNDLINVAAHPFPATDKNHKAITIGAVAMPWTSYAPLFTQQQIFMGT
jgi:hypothetical protein